MTDWNMAMQKQAEVVHISIGRDISPNVGCSVPIDAACLVLRAALSEADAVIFNAHECAIERGRKIEDAIKHLRDNNPAAAMSVLLVGK